jgi:predicted house-cleaning NTP pyrophosphatase (Maf/HAM1 superfamily)
MKLPQRVILASGSPRRQELLKYVIPRFEIIPSGAPEEAKGAPAPRDVELALIKARDLAAKNADALVIGADTLVALRGACWASRGTKKTPRYAAHALRLHAQGLHRPRADIRGKERTACCVTDVTFAKRRKRRSGITSPRASRWTRRARTAFRAMAPSSSRA